MKNSIGGILALLLAGLFFQACDEDVPPPVELVNPDDLRFEGNWQGSSSQTKLLSLQVENTENAANVRECSIGYVEEDIFKQRSLSAIFGLSEITEGAFSILLPDGGSMSGNFNSTDHCTGKLVIPGASSEYSFELTQDTNPESLLSPARIYFEISGVAYEFIQDDIFYIPERENIRTGTGLLVNSSFTRLDNASGKKHPVITITTGRIADLQELLVIFAPGQKKYSRYAVQGFDVTLHHPDEFFAAYNTSNFTGNQDGSFFEVVDVKEIETFGTDYELYKFSAAFSCKVYRPWGSGMVVESGFYSGYFDTKSFQ